MLGCILVLLVVYCGTRRLDMVLEGRNDIMFSMDEMSGAEKMCG